MKIKLDTWYDVSCSRCAKSRSTDYERGMEQKKFILSKRAYAEGWKCRGGETLCPVCASRKEAQ